MKAVTVEKLNYLVGVAHSPQVGVGERFVPASYLVRTLFGDATDVDQMLIRF